MVPESDLRAAKKFLCDQLLQLGLGGGVIARRVAISVAAALANAGRNVHAVGIGPKRTGDQEDGPSCVRVYVVQKLPLSLLAPRDVIPATIDGVPTDVVEADPPFLHAAQRRGSKRGSRRQRGSSSNTTAASCTSGRRQQQRPLQAGISACHRDVTSGTLGCFCRSTASADDADQVFVLSNNHVFAQTNQALLGDPLYQPSPEDGGGFDAQFATLQRFVPIRTGGDVANRVDAALGRLLPSVAVTPEVCEIGSIAGVVAAEQNMLVRKHGRTTGYTAGRIDDVDYTGLVGLDPNDTRFVARFEQQLRIVPQNFQPFGLRGDSGSIVVEQTSQNVVGLYFAGSPLGTYSLANRIENVIAELEIAIG